MASMFLRYRKALWLGGLLLLSALLAWCGYAQTALFAWQRDGANRASQAYYELLENMNQMENSLLKLSVSNDQSQYRQLLGKIAVQAQAAAGNLADLPTGRENREENMQFVQQVGDLASSLLKTGKLNKTQKEQIQTVTEACHALREKLLAQEMPDGELNSESAFLDDGVTVEYPHLIYDGPFSEGHEDGESRGLDGLESMSQEELLVSAGEYLPGQIMHLGTQSDALACELFADETGSTAAITQKGGKLRWLLRDRELGEATLSGDECAQMAQKLLEEMGFPAMAVSWVQEDTRSATISLVAVQEDIWLYPDMVKLKLARDNGELLALDATEYWAHHEKRELDMEIISPAEAEDGLIAGFQCEAMQRVLAKVNGEEKLLWQACGKMDGAEYFILLNAQNGQQEDIFRVVQTDMGILVV